MSRPVRIGEEAEVELRESVAWYERHRRGLGREFLAAVNSAIGRLESDPRIGSSVHGVEDEEIRRIFVRRFPFHVVYLELPDRLQVLAVAHDRRRPAYWRDRIER